MNGQEIATAVQYGAAFVALVVNNGMYGTIRMHQEREYPGRVFGTDLQNPDFAAYARAFGGHGETVERTRGLRAGLRARAGFGQAGADRAEDRSRRHHPGDHAFGDPGKGAQAPTSGQ